MFFYEDQQFGGDCMYNSFVLENCDFPYHFHKTFELIFIYSGNLSVTINDKQYDIKKNELAFIFPYQLHSFACHESCRFVLLIFPAEIIAGFYRNYKDMYPENNVITYNSNPHDKFIFKDIYDCKSFLYQMCSRLISQTKFIPLDQPQTEQNNLLYSLINYVQKHYKETCTLQQVSKEFGYDYYYLSKYFRKKLGLTFTEYINQYRILQACFMLNNTKETISDIAMQCGYDNLRTFNRNFRLYTGYSPTKYRTTL